jgi:hypothetical protein
MKEFVRSSLLQEQDRMHTYDTGAAYRLPVLLMNWTGNSLVVIDKTVGCSAYLATRVKISS